MDRLRKLELIERSLGIRHKLKVHESMKAPDSHEELAIMMISKWELEDELRAIEEVLGEARLRNVAAKRRAVGSEDDSLPPEERESAAKSRMAAKAKKKK
jgi:hypothetical protein